MSKKFRGLMAVFDKAGKRLPRHVLHTWELGRACSNNLSMKFVRKIRDINFIQPNNIVLNLELILRNVKPMGSI